MVKRVMMIGLLGISMVAMLETSVYAQRLVGGYGFATKGVKCTFKGAGIGSDDVNVTAAVCNVLNVQEAIFHCTNKPGQTPQSHVSTQVVDFVEGIVLASTKNCDKKGTCKFDLIVNAVGLGQRSPGCVSPQWNVVDVVPSAFDFELQLVQCFNGNGPVSCNDPSATFSTIDERRGHCDLPDPQTLQFGDERAYECFEF
jgi:hypothetical protein